ncbi:hypothetical protein R1flu_003578 [Riccia fluitans]|uniref:Uncharacterized protein n=1 Tax=Riccia fluitans TaxID=41844 RepID=A0ABD1Y9I5_9MARC
MTTGLDITDSAEMLLSEKIFLLESSRQLQERISAFNRMVGPEGKIISDVTLKDTLVLPPKGVSESRTSNDIGESSSSQGACRETNGRPSSKAMPLNRLAKGKDLCSNGNPAKPDTQFDQELGREDWPSLGRQGQTGKQTQPGKGKRNSKSVNLVLPSKEGSCSGNSKPPPGNLADDNDLSNREGISGGKGKNPSTATPEPSFNWKL